MPVKINVIAVPLNVNNTGRIDRKIEFPLPDEKTRRRIFTIHTSKMTLASDLDLEEYITAKDDLSGADIKVCIFLYEATVYMYMYVWAWCVHQW